MPKKQRTDGQPNPPVSTPGLFTHNNQRLFSDYFLDSIMTSEGWRNREEIALVERETKYQYGEW